MIINYTKIESIDGLEIIVYSWSIINANFFLSHEWWVSLIKFMMGPTIHVSVESMHLWYSGSTK